MFSCISQGTRLQILTHLDSFLRVTSCHIYLTGGHSFRDLFGTVGYRSFMTQPSQISMHWKKSEETDPRLAPTIESRFLAKRPAKLWSPSVAICFKANSLEEVSPAIVDSQWWNCLKLYCSLCSCCIHSLATTLIPGSMSWLWILLTNSFIYILFCFTHDSERCSPVQSKRDSCWTSQNSFVYFLYIPFLLLHVSRMLCLWGRKKNFCAVSCILSCGSQNIDLLSPSCVFGPFFLW